MSMETEKVLQDSSNSGLTRNLTLELAGNISQALSALLDLFDNDFEPIVMVEEVELEHNVWDSLNLL